MSEVNMSLKAKQLSALFGLLVLSLSACAPQGERSPAAAPNAPVASANATSGNATEGSPTPETLQIEESPLTVSFHAQRSPAGRARVAVAYRRSVGDIRARAVELYLRVGDGLSYRGVSAGLAVLESEKELIVQQPQDDLLRVVIFSRGSLAPLDDGPLFILDFEALRDGAKRLELLREQPLFAPSEANRALHLPETFSFDGAR